MPDDYGFQPSSTAPATATPAVASAPAGNYGFTPSQSLPTRREPETKDNYGFTPAVPPVRDTAPASAAPSQPIPQDQPQPDQPAAGGSTSSTPIQGSSQPPTGDSSESQPWPQWFESGLEA